MTGGDPSKTGWVMLAGAIGGAAAGYGLMGNKFTLKVTAGDIDPTDFKYRTKGLNQIGQSRIRRPIIRYKSVRLL